MKCSKKGGSISFEDTKLSVRSYLIQNVKELDYRLRLYKAFLKVYRASTPIQLSTILGGNESKEAKKRLINQTHVHLQQMYRERKLLKHLLSLLRKTKATEVFPEKLL